MTGIADDNAEIHEQLLAIVAKEGLVERDALLPDVELETLGIASADFILILMSVEEEFGVYISVDAELSEVRTVGGLLTAVTKRILDHRQEHVS